MSVTRFKIQKPGQILLHKFQDTVVVRMHLDEGNYVIIGRVVIRNGDGDTQKASAQIRAFGAKTAIDRADITLADEPVCESVSLQGVFKADVGQRIELACATFDGEAAEASLIAIPVDTFAEGKD